VGGLLLLFVRGHLLGMEGGHRGQVHTSFQQVYAAAVVIRPARCTPDGQPSLLLCWHCLLALLAMDACAQLHAASALHDTHVCASLLAHLKKSALSTSLGRLL
jgi:hypothetical protein